MKNDYSELPEMGRTRIESKDLTLKLKYYPGTEVYRREIKEIRSTSGNRKLG